MAFGLYCDRFKNFTDRHACPLGGAQQSEVNRPVVARALHEVQSTRSRHAFQAIQREFHGFACRRSDYDDPGLRTLEEVGGACPYVKLCVWGNVVCRRKARKIRNQTTVEFCAVRCVQWYYGLV